MSEDSENLMKIFNLIEYNIYFINTAKLNEILLLIKNFIIIYFLYNITIYFIIVKLAHTHAHTHIHTHTHTHTYAHTHAHTKFKTHTTICDS